MRSTSAPATRMATGSMEVTSAGETMMPVMSLPPRQGGRLRAGGRRAGRVRLLKAALHLGEAREEAVHRLAGRIEERLGHEAHHADEHEERRDHHPPAQRQVEQAGVLLVLERAEEDALQ